MSETNFDIRPTIIVLGILVLALIFLFAPSGNLYDYLKQKRLEHHYQQEFEKHKIVCNQCKGSGEYPTDINKLMMDASLALFINHHLMVDKCTKCVKMPYGDAYDYCDTVQDKYQILVQEYADAGPKIDMAACEQCMGMGQFTSVKKDGSYMTQDEYDNNHKKD